MWKQFDGALRANKPKLTIVYDVPASVPVPDKSSVALGGSLTTLDRVLGASHVIAYRIGTATLASYNIGTATSHTYTIPTSAGTNFPNALTAALTVEVTTTVDGESRGSVTHEVTLTLPSDAAPTASCSISRTWVAGVSSAAQIGAMCSARAARPSPLPARAGTELPWRASASRSMARPTSERERQHPAPTDFGQRHNGLYLHRHRQRGLSREYTGSLNVLAWTEPKIAQFAIARVRADGTEAVDGTYALASVQANISSLKVGGVEKNGISYYIRYREAGTEAWTSGDTNAVSGTSVSASALIHRQNADVGSFNDMSGYEFQLVLSDIYASSEAMDEMPTKDVRLCLDQNTGSIGFGGEARTEEDGPHYDFYGPVHFRAGSTGQTVYSAEEVDTGSVWIDGRPIYRAVIRGASMLVGAQDAFATLPSDPENVIDMRLFVNMNNVGWRPIPNTYYGALAWSCNVYMEGPVINLGFGSSWTKHREVVVIVEYTKRSDAPAYYYLPFLSADSDKGCVLTASSEYSSGYPVEYAFNGLTSNYWACTNNDSQRWVQVQMPTRCGTLL